jgi:transposase-like protein
LHPERQPAPVTEPELHVSQAQRLIADSVLTQFCNRERALKCLYLVTRSLDPTGTGRTRWAMRWKPALNAFAITFGDRFPAAETY